MEKNFFLVHPLTFLSFWYLSSGVSKPFVNAVTEGPSLIPRFWEIKKVFNLSINVNVKMSVNYSLVL